MTEKQLQSYMILHTALEFEEWIKCVREKLLRRILEMKAEKVTILEEMTQWKALSFVTYNHHHQILLVHSNEGERYELNVKHE